MKLQHINNKINSHDIIGSAFSPGKIIEEGVISYPIYSINKKIISITNNSNKGISSHRNCLLSFKCFDRLGMESSWDIEIGHICIIGNEEDFFVLSRQINNCFERHGYHLNTVTPDQFFRTGRSNNYASQIYLIHINPAQVSCNRIEVIIDQCKTKFIFPLEGLKLTFLKRNKIIASLGENIPFRKILIASLNQNEFLAININHENVLSFKEGQGNV